MSGRYKKAFAWVMLEIVSFYIGLALTALTAWAVVLYGSSVGLDSWSLFQIWLQEPIAFPRWAVLCATVFLVLFFAFGIWRSQKKWKALAARQDQLAEEHQGLIDDLTKAFEDAASAYEDAKGPPN